MFDDVFDGPGNFRGVGKEVDVRRFEVMDHLLVIQDVGCSD